jgi:hypothetical protein
MTKDIGIFYEELSDDEVKFLKAYAESCSVEQARKDTKLHHTKVEMFTKKPAVIKEMALMQSSFRAQWRLSAAAAAGRHIQLMDKAEALLDKGDTKALSSLAKMSETSLKATGHFDSGEQNMAAQVSVSINIGGDAPSELNINVGELSAPVSEPELIDVTPEEESEDGS